MQPQCMTKRQLDNIMAYLTKRHGDNKQAWLAELSGFLGRPISSARDLTFDDAAAFIDAINANKANQE